ncbi:MAG: hypothetical protein ACC608_02860 [Anaerofustis sp.]
MKKQKKGLSVLIAGLLVFSLSGCGLIGFSGSNELYGDDYIEYYNSDRDAVIKQYVGDKVATTSDDLYDIEVTYEQYSGNTYYVYIDNYNTEYFYNGVVTISKGSEKYAINVKMLAPDFYEYCMISLNGNPEQYDYEITGNFYDYNSRAWTLSADYEEYYDDYAGYLVFDTDTLNVSLAKEAADLYYAYDTLWNFDIGNYYYLYDRNYADDSDYEYYMYVDTPSRQVMIYDKNDKAVATQTY